MTTRPVFVSKDHFPYYEEIKGIEFVFNPGFALVQKQKNIEALHKAFNEKFDGKIIEISSKSPVYLGTRLSAFNLPYELDGVEVSLESVFQGSKVFENGGPYHDIYKKGPVEAKKDPRIRESGAIVAFSLNGQLFSNEPRDYFYNWIYSSAMYSHQDLIKQLSEYEAFTDIEFNPKKSLNCQARTVAILRGLMKGNMLDTAMESPESYLDIVYHTSGKEQEPIQLSLFD